MGAIPPTIVESLPKGGQRRITSTDAARCLADWAFADREAFLGDAILSGNAYCVIRRNDRGAPFRLEWMPSWRVGLWVGTDGSRWYEIMADDPLGEPEERIEPRDMVHVKFRMVGIRHRYLGLSPLVAVAPSMGLVLSVRRVGGALYRNYAAPAIYLAHPGRVKLESLQRLKDRWKQMYGGGRTGDVAVLSEGMTAVTVDPAKALDAQLSEMTKITVADCARALQVPLSLLAETSDTNYSTSTEEARSFARYSLQPWVGSDQDTCKK